MDDLEKIPEAKPPEEAPEPADRVNLQSDIQLNVQPELQPDARRDAQPAPEALESLPPAREIAWSERVYAISREDMASRRRSFRHNLKLLLTLTLGAFVLTAWILVRADSPFGLFSTGPSEVARAQLRALDRGEFRPAYDMFSPRYRQQVSFDVWHELIITHWRMFHAEVLRAGTPAQIGSRATLEMDVRGADDVTYRARFTMIRLEGRWWIDDVHWAEEGREKDLVRS